MQSQQNEPDVFEDHTVKSGKTGSRGSTPAPVSPGPSGTEDNSLSKRDDSGGKGFSTVPGAGPNPAG